MKGVNLVNECSRRVARHGPRPPAAVAYWAALLGLALPPCFIGRGEEEPFGHLDEGNSLLTLDSGELLEELVERVAGGEVVEETLHGETRVFYDVRDETVEVLAIVAKRQAQGWLAEQGTPEPNGGVGEGEG
jgi:hypothetical protein